MPWHVLYEWWLRGSCPYSVRVGKTHASDQTCFPSGDGLGSRRGIIPVKSYVDFLRAMVCSAEGRAQRLELEQATCGARQARELMQRTHLQPTFAVVLLRCRRLYCCVSAQAPP